MEIEALEKRVTDNRVDIDIHDILLRGDPKNRKDDGITGVINNIEQALATFKKWQFAIGSSVLIAALLGIYKLGLDIYTQVNGLK